MEVGAALPGRRVVPRPDGGGVGVWYSDGPVPVLRGAAREAARSSGDKDIGTVIFSAFERPANPNQRQEPPFRQVTLIRFGSRTRAPTVGVTPPGTQDPHW